jgi:hypothetical protein
MGSALKANGIQFPAVQVPSADPNHLDDYEEGTWTPVPTGLTVVGTPTYTGTYTKVGRLVFATLRVQSTTSTASTATVTSFAGMPFSPSSAIATCQATDTGATNLGTGLFTGTVFPPSWSARADVIITFTFAV